MSICVSLFDIKLWLEFYIFKLHQEVKVESWFLWLLDGWWGCRRKIHTTTLELCSNPMKWGGPSFRRIGNHPFNHPPKGSVSDGVVRWTSSCRCPFFEVEKFIGNKTDIYIYTYVICIIYFIYIYIVWWSYKPTYNDSAACRQLVNSHLDVQ